MSNEVRLIDANTLKKAIELFCEDERTNMTAIAYFALMELVDTMPTIEAEPDNGWINVKDRLPDGKELYLVCTENERIYIAYYQPLGDKFSNREPFWQGSSCRFTSVTHWQPLPELPKGE